MKSFKEYVNENNITIGAWESLEDFMRKQPGFVSWDIDNGELVIKFKKNIQAIKAQQKSNNSFTEISAFGDSSAGNSEIRVELYDEAIKAL